MSASSSGSTISAPIATEIRVAFAGQETPAAIAKRLGLTETQVADALNYRQHQHKRKPGIKRGHQNGVTNWQDAKQQRTNLDTCPLECTRERPHRIAAGLYVCAECWEWEHSEQPIIKKETR